jgi:hypothetical protein
MEEEEEESSTSSNDESQLEPESDTEEFRADINNRIDQYLSTEHWTEARWIRQREEDWYRWYNHYWRAMRRIRRRRPHIIPFDENDYSDVRYAAYVQHRPAARLLDITIRRHRVREGILEVDVYRVVQSMCNRRISYETEVWGMDPEIRRTRRMDKRGFPQDSYHGRRIYGQFEGLHIRWYPMIQLLHTCPDVVMTYFLRARPMEIVRDTSWPLWNICYGMIRYEEAFRPQLIRWRYLDYAVDMSETENENDIDEDSDDTLS